jgi:hypothetical protein
MGPKMRRILDIEEVAAALKRAAEKAMHGTREERSGRFLPTTRRKPASKEGAPKRPSRQRKG